MARKLDKRVRISPDYTALGGTSICLCSIQQASGLDLPIQYSHLRALETLIFSFARRHASS